MGGEDWMKDIAEPTEEVCEVMVLTPHQYNHQSLTTPDPHITSHQEVGNFTNLKLKLQLFDWCLHMYGMSCD